MLLVFPLNPFLAIAGFRKEISSLKSTEACFSYSVEYFCRWLSFLCVFRPPLPSSVQCCCPRLGLVFWSIGIGQWGALPRDWREGGLSIYLFLDFLLETVSYSNAAIPLQGPQSTQLSFLQILKTSLPVVGSLYQLVATAPLLLTLVPELSFWFPQASHRTL